MGQGLATSFVFREWAQTYFLFRRYVERPPRLRLEAQLAESVSYGVRVNEIASSPIEICRDPPSLRIPQLHICSVVFSAHAGMWQR